MYTIPLSHKQICIRYGIDSPSGEAGQRSKDALSSIPELKNLSGKISESELYHRARVISKLKELSRDPKKTFGVTKSTVNSVGVENALNNMKELITALSTLENIQNLGNKEIVAWFKGWDGVDDTNVAVVSGTRMTYRKFLSNVINDSELVGNLFARPNESREMTEEKEIIEQRTRLGTFLVALESRNADNEHKTMFRQAHQALIEKNLPKAKDIVRKTLKSEWNIDVESVVTEHGKIAALRAIGATHEATQSTVKQAANLKEKSRDSLSQKEQDLIDEIHNNLEKEKAKNKHIAADIYGVMLRSIPESDPYRKQVERSRENMIEEIVNEKAYISILDGYIKKNGSEGLGSMFDAYNDMRGLYGSFNFTDENAKLTKEVAIMLASFVLTAGVGPALGALGAGARILTAGKTIDVASKSGTLARNVARARNVATQTLAKSGTVLQGANGLDKTLSTSRLGKTLWEATKFTTAESFIRTFNREAGEKSGFDTDFGEKLAKNTAMFGLFGGMEKYISGPLKTRAIEALGLKSGITQFTVGTTILTTGDVAAMWALGMAESGNIHIPEAMEIYQALAFRIGMKGTEQLLPKLSQQYKEIQGKRKGSNGTGSIETPVQQTNIKKNTAYYERADKFVVSKSNKSDIKRFQKEGYDLAEIGFDGWNVRQSQKKGGVSYILTKNGSQGEYTFTTREALQQFLTTNKTVSAPVSGEAIQTTPHRENDTVYGAKLETESPYTLNIGKAPVPKVPESLPRKKEPQQSSLQWTTSGGKYERQGDGTIKWVSEGKPQGTAGRGQNQSGENVGAKTREAKKDPLLQLTYTREAGKGVSKPEGKKKGEPVNTPVSETGTKIDTGVEVTSGRMQELNQEKSILTKELKRLERMKRERAIPESVQSTVSPLLEKISHPKRGDIVQFPDGKEWRYTANGERWQQRIDGKTWAGMDYTEGVLKTTKELQKEVKQFAQKQEAIYIQETLQPLREKISHPKRGDIVQFPDGKEWRYTANGERWQQRIDGKTWAGMDYTEGVLKTTKELQSTLLTDSERISAQIKEVKGKIQEKEETILKEKTENPPKIEQEGTPKEKEGDSVVSETAPGKSQGKIGNEGLVTTKEYTASDIVPVGKPGEKITIDGREYRWSDKQQGWVGKSKDGVHTIIKPGKGAIGNPEGTKTTEKAGETIPPERQLEYKKAIDAIEPGLTTGINEVIRNPSKMGLLKEHIRENWKKYAAAGILLSILGYLYLTHKKNNPDSTIPAPTENDGATQGNTLSYCENFSNNPKSKLDLERESDAGEGIILSEKRRENISRRWMRTREWKELENAILRDPHVTGMLSDEFHELFAKTQDSPTITNVQELQRIIGMKDEDAKTGQDGILGPRTTQRIRAYIIACMNPSAPRNNPSSAPEVTAQTGNTGKEEISYDGEEWEDTEAEST